MDLNVQILGLAEGSRDETSPRSMQEQPGHGSVEVQRARLAKPFLGGYRHRTTALEYHHAATQTVPKSRPRNQVKSRRERVGGCG